MKKSRSEKSAQQNCRGKLATPTDSSDYWIGLLVSVRSRSEVDRIADLGVDIIDFKEPAAGALGNCPPRLWHECVAAYPKQRRWSVALGELSSVETVSLAREVPPKVCFAKAGPAGITSTALLKKRWQALIDQLPTTTELVAVAYADAGRAQCLSPEHIIDAACDLQVRTLLIDTFDKRSGPLPNLVKPSQLEALLRQTRQAGLSVVLAGSLSLPDLQPLAETVAKVRVQTAGTGDVDRVGVRGCVCRGGRNGEIIADLVKGVLGALQSSANKQGCD